MEIERDGTDSGLLLLATKFHAPRWHADLVSRPRLVETLRRGAERKLTLVSAPAGFGKTTLLAEWLAGDSGRAASWLSLDQQDNDPARFWTYAIAALQVHEPTLGVRAVALLHALQPPSIESILTSLINELSSSSRSFVLVLDDLHTIEHRAIHEGLGFLLDHLPPQLRLVATTRADPPLNLSRLRARGEMNELRAADLRFTTDEERAFLNDVMGLSLSDDDVRALDDQTEGWVAGLQLAGLSIRSHDDASRFIRTFAGDHRYIVDYLLEEVLQQQSEETCAFLLQTSVLDRLCGPLCDFVTGLEGGSERLIALERGNFFLVPLDSTRTWYRYHHLFGDVLRARLLAEFPERVGPLHVRASEWFAQRGSTAAAIDHALAAGAYDRAAELIELVATRMRQNRQEATVLQWLRAIPEDDILCRPVLSTVYAGILLSNGLVDRVDFWLRNSEGWLERMRETEPDAPDGMLVSDFEEFGRMPGAVSVYRAGLAMATGDIPGVVAHATAALGVIDERDAIYHGAASALLGLAAWFGGDLEEAYASFSGGLASLRRGGFVVDSIGGSNALLDISIAQGRLRDAMELCQQGIALAVEHGLEAPRGLADMYAGMSRVHGAWNELDAAADDLARCAELGEGAGFPQFPFRWRVAEAELLASRGDLEGAVGLLDEAEPRYIGDMFPNVWPIPALRARVWIKQGRLDAAREWARGAGISDEDEISFLRSYEHLTLARLLLAEAGDEAGDRAMRLLERLASAAKAGGWVDSHIEALVLQALGYQRMGRQMAARASLERALELGEPGGYVRVFVDEGEPMRRLLQEVIGESPGGYAGRVLRSWGVPERVSSVPAATADLPEPLTPREIEVLQLIAAGLRNQEIADRLFISLPTVKRHVANAYGKLGVTHRTEAIARATALGIL